MDFLFAWLKSEEGLKGKISVEIQLIHNTLEQGERLRHTPDHNIDSKVNSFAEIHDRGHSSPVVYSDQIWVTTAKDDGREVYAVCIDFQAGKIIHDIKVFTPEEVDVKHNVNTYARPAI